MRLALRSFALLAFALCVQRAAAKEILFPAFVEYADLPTTPALIIDFKAGQNDQVLPVSPENVAMMLTGAEQLHADALLQFRLVQSAMDKKDPALDLKGSKDRIARLRRSGFPDLRVRFNSEGNISQISYNSDTNSFYSRSQFIYRVKGGNGAVMAIVTTTSEGFLRYWFFRDDQSLMGTMRCDGAGMVTGTLLRWDEKGKLTQAVSMSASSFFFDNPFQQ